MADEETITELESKIKPRLERLARKRRRRADEPDTITYEALASEVGPLVGVPDLTPNDRRLHYALSNISVKSYRRHRILLSVLVVNKNTRMPGGGFFWLATKGLTEEGMERNAYPSSLDNYEIFRDASDRVHDHYGRRRIQPQ